MTEHECDHLPGRLRAICEGKVDLPLWKINRYRERLEMAPLEARPGKGPAAQRAGSSVPWVMGRGPGSCLVATYTRRGMPSCQACLDLAAKMDRWGVAGCRERLDEIAEDILLRAREWLGENLPWVHRVLSGVGLEDAALRKVIRHDVNQAIRKAEQHATRDGAPSRPFPRRGSRLSHASGHVETESAAVAADPVWKTEPEYQRLAAGLLSRTEIVVKSFMRHTALAGLISSVRRFYPSLPILVVDDSFKHGETSDEAERVKSMSGVTWYSMPFDSGLPAGRNRGVRASSAEFVILCDDDMVFTPQTDLTALLVGLNKTDVDIFGGLSRRKGKEASNWCGRLELKRSVLVMRPLGTPVEVVAGIRFRRSDITYNFFAARREFLLAHPWDERFKIGGEHLDSFLAWKAAGVKVAFTVDCVCDETDADNSPEYKAFRRRNVSYATLNKKHGITTRRTIGTTRFPGV